MGADGNLRQLMMLPTANAGHPRLSLESTTKEMQPLQRTSSSSQSIITDYAPTTLATLPYEILEAILLHLPIEDLLLCQQVCHGFRQMVSSSKPIRRALFLEPSHHSGSLSEWELIKWNPFLETKLADSLDIRVIGVHRGAEGTVKMVAHVRFRKDALVDPDWVDILLDDYASWKSMLVTQPPATLLMHPVSNLSYETSWMLTSPLSASLFWKSDLEHQADFYHDAAGFTLLDLVSCVDW